MIVCNSLWRKALVVLFAIVAVLPAVGSSWQPDFLSGYEQRRLALGNGDVATVVRHLGNVAHRRAVVYLHGFNDYFFQSQLGDSIVAHGYSFYAVDLRRYGRSLRQGERPFDVGDLAVYFEEIDSVLSVAKSEGIRNVYLLGHSTGGLILSYYLQRRGTGAGFIKGLMLNSPFLDMNLSWFEEKILVPIVSIMPFKSMLISQGNSRAYSESLLKKYHGEWNYNTSWKFEVSPKVSVGWITAIHRAQKKLHKNGVDLGVPILLMRSAHSVSGGEWTEEFNRGDSVLDVNDISKFGQRLGSDVDEYVFDGGLHDLILSAEPVRNRVYATMFMWLSAR